MTPENAYIGDRIREARHARRMSQTALGEKLGVTYQQIQKFESGRSTISSAQLIKVADALRRPIHFFMPTVESTRADPTISRMLALKETQDLAPHFVALPQRSRIMLVELAQLLGERICEGAK